MYSAYNHPNKPSFLVHTLQQVPGSVLELMSTQEPLYNYGSTKATIAIESIFHPKHVISPDPISPRDTGSDPRWGCLGLGTRLSSSSVFPSGAL